VECYESQTQAACSLFGWLEPICPRRTKAATFQAALYRRVMMRLFDPLVTTDRMREIFSDTGRLQRMLDFEAALARALGRAGLVPQPFVASIEACCEANLFSHEAIASGAVLAGNLAIPLVKELTTLVAKSDEKAAGFVHFGATSQDVIDTGLVLQLRDAFDDTEKELARLSLVLRRLTEAHRETLLAGRTWLQQASPTTLGLKFAGWLDAVERHRERFNQARKRVEVLQFGGAVGTLAALGGAELQAEQAVATELNLALPALPWHTQHDRFAEVATIYGLLAGTLGKIARDISLMSQTEVGELAEPSVPGRGGSSTLPHKKNPVGCSVILAAAIRVPGLVSTMLSAIVQEHERGLGGWQAEWETLPEICMLTAGALSHLIEVMDGLEIYKDAMARNLNATHGLVMAEAVAMTLAKKIGKMPAHQLVERASQQAVESGKALREILVAEREITRHLSSGEIDSLLDPKNYTGSAQAMIDRVLSVGKKSSH
jgi:3-carboxy-cis,cis-muconate cycloisomerase